MAKAKAIGNKLRLKRKDMISTGARTQDDLLVVEPFALMLDMLFKTEGEPAPKNVLNQTELTCNKVLIDYTRKMGVEVASLNKEVKGLFDKDQKGDDKAYGKAVEACKKAVRNLEGKLFNELRDSLRQTLEKTVDKSKDAALVPKSVQTAGMSGFRNSRRAIYIVPGVFTYEQETDSSFGKAAASITKGGDALTKEARSIGSHGKEIVLAGTKYIKTLTDYKADDAKGPKLLEGKRDREFSQDYLQNDQGTFNKLNQDNSQYVGALEDFADQLSGIEKELTGFDKLLKNKKKTLSDKARDDAKKLSGAMLKNARSLRSKVQSLKTHSVALGNQLDDSMVPKVARKPMLVGAPVKAIGSENFDERDKLVKDLAKGCDLMKKIIDNA